MKRSRFIFKCFLLLTVVATFTTTAAILFFDGIENSNDSNSSIIKKITLSRTTSEKISLRQNNKTKGMIVKTKKLKDSLIVKSSNNLHESQIKIEGIIKASHDIDLRHVILILLSAKDIMTHLSFPSGSSFPKNTIFRNKVDQRTGSFSLNVNKEESSQRKIFAWEPKQNAKSNSVPLNFSSNLDRLETGVLELQKLPPTSGTITDVFGFPLKDVLVVIDPGEGLFFEDYVHAIDKNRVKNKNRIKNHKTETIPIESVFDFEKEERSLEDLLANPSEIIPGQAISKCVQTDENGEFSITGLFSTEFSLIGVFKPGYCSSIKRLKNGPNNFVLPKSKSIRVKVLDLSEQPIENLSVTFYKQQFGLVSSIEDTYFYGLYPTTLKTNNQGKISLDSVAVDSITIKIRSKDHGFFHKEFLLKNQVNDISISLKRPPTNVKFNIENNSQKRLSIILVSKSNQQLIKKIVVNSRSHKSDSFHKGPAIFEFNPECDHRQQAFPIDLRSDYLTKVQLDFGECQKYTVKLISNNKVMKHAVIYNQSAYKLYSLLPIGSPLKKIFLDKTKFKIAKIGQTNDSGIAHIDRFPGPCYLIVKSREGVFKLVLVKFPPENGQPICITVDS